MSTILTLIYYFTSDGLRPIDILLFVYVDAVYVTIWAVIRWLIRRDRNARAWYEENNDTSTWD